MSKRHALEAKFTDLAQTSIRWPTKGDKPFKEAATSGENALIAKDEHARLVLMTDGYKKAADILVECTVDDPRDRDLLVFPILFNYRHFIELSLKYQLASFGSRVGLSSNWRTHDLLQLWIEFADMLHRYGTNDPDEADPVVADIVLEFAKIDPRSDANRYPVDRKGGPIPVSQSALDLANLADVMKAVEVYFNGCDGYLSDLVGA